MGTDNTVEARTIELLGAVRPQSPGECAQLVEEGGSLALLGMPEEVYHARPEISASGMKVLLRSPKAFRAIGEEPERKRSQFALGTAVHTRVLGTGLPVVEIPDHLLSGEYRSVSSKAAKEWVANAEREGQVPLKPKDYLLTVKASDAILMHPKARPLLEQGGVSEVSMFATDPDSGVRLRGRSDRIAGLSILDVKTTTSLATRKLQMTVDDFSYDLSMETYRYLFELITGQVADPAVLIFVEKDPPYDVRVVRLEEDEWSEGGWQKLRRALDVFARCTAEGVWPGVDEEGPVEGLPAPGWYATRVRAGELEAVEAD